MSEEYIYIACSTPGMAGTTPLMVKKTEDGFEARRGFALFGSTNMSDEQFKACDYNPFHEDFHDNYHRGIGETEEAAVEALKKDASDMYEHIWI